MMEEKIIQIMAAPENMYAIYEEDPSNPMETKIICFALTNLGEVFPMDINDVGDMEDVTTASNFKEIKWKKEDNE